MVRVCGKLGSRVCGLLGSVCGSVGLAVLVVALAAMATRHAYAEDPSVILNCPCDPNDPNYQECLAACQIPPCSQCSNGCTNIPKERGCLGDFSWLHCFTSLQLPVS
ncbi:hypothetical protein [Thermogemmata fonticola]|jgi:hypothetical protein|uniref:Uncharacterized protein n=1 Tax=Thermogemmata fonticola TaxID=2755323 RepID=A0A7V8VDR2_9BACT|nr:hypothetical protein [Thermogemmata fonticola]MBA2226198.1 hypothetical protein [Thermogemmata fonticola]